MSTFLESITGLSFVHPWALLLALAVPLALWLRRRRGVTALTFAPSGIEDGDGAPARAMPSTWRTRLLPLPVALQSLALLLAVAAIARPVRREPMPLRSEGIDVLICLDVSSSMTARDMDAQRSRLAVATDAASAFVRGRPDDRIGLVTFARYPDVRCPLTLDHVALVRLLGGVETVPSEGPEDATGIGTAVARSAQLLKGSTAKSKVVILLSDGEENVALAQKPGEIAPQHAAQLCEALGVRVYAIAASGDGAGGRARPDTAPIEAMAKRTGGRFFEARDAGAVDAVYAEIDALEKSSLAERRFSMEDRFQPLLAAAVALLLAGRLLSATILGVLP